MLDSRWIVKKKKKKRKEEKKRVLMHSARWTRICLLFLFRFGDLNSDRIYCICARMEREVKLFRMIIRR